MVQTRSRIRAALANKLDAPFRILDLPPELVQQIFAHLANESPSALLPVRFACRAFQVHSLQAFGTSFFKHVIAILHPLSLTVLLEIASHPQLSKFVHQVTISGERIGGLIDLSGQENGQKLKDMQTSMEKSGMDRLMLTEVFRRLPHVMAVKIDNATYRCEDDGLDGARCGTRYIFTDQEKPPYQMKELGFNRAFEVVFACLHNTGLAGTFAIDINATVKALEPQNDVLFDLTSFVWERMLAKTVFILKFSGELSSRWTLDLLQSLPNLHVFEVFIADDILELSHPDTGLFYWPNLHSLQLDDAYCHGRMLLEFLDAHKDTLSDLHLQGVELLTGSWKQLFAIMERIPALSYMFIGVPYETTVPPHDDRKFDRFYDFNDKDFNMYNFRLHSNAEIRIVLGALLYDFRTTKYKSYHGHLDTQLFRVDFRLAKAVVNAKAELREGESHMLL
jgi:hypothetical protein